MKQLWVYAKLFFYGLKNRELKVSWEIFTLIRSQKRALKKIRAGTHQPLTKAESRRVGELYGIKQRVSESDEQFKGRILNKMTGAKK